MTYNNMGDDTSHDIASVAPLELERFCAIENIRLIGPRCDAHTDSTLLLLYTVSTLDDTKHHGEDALVITLLDLYGHCSLVHNQCRSSKAL